MSARDGESARRPLLRHAWIAVAVAVIAGIAAWMHYDGSGALLAALKDGRDTLAGQFLRHPAATLAAYFAFYALTAIVWMPGSALLMLAAGAIFGFGVGCIAASFASALAATLAFLSSRYLLHDFVQARFGGRLVLINEGMRRDGALYLLCLRLIPVIPYFLVNLLVALTPIGAWRFYWVTQVGLLGLVVIYVNAGTQLAAIDALGDVLSPTVLASLALLAVFPLLMKPIVKALRRRLR